MDNILNIKDFIDSKISLIPEVVLFDNINFKCVTETSHLDWLNIPNITSIHYEKIYKSVITLDNNEQKIICIKASSANSFLNSEGKTSLTYYITRNNINQKINSLRENYSYFSYTYNSSFIKSNVIFFNSRFLSWTNDLLNKYINLEFIEYLDGYSSSKIFFNKSSFVNSLKLLVKILDIIKILIDNNLLHGDLGMYNVITKGTDIDTIDIKIIDYENMIDLLNNNDNLNLNTKIYDNESSIYQDQEYHSIQLKDVEFYDSNDDSKKPSIFCYVYQLDYLRLLSSFSEIYKYKPEFNIIYNIIKHCVDNHLNVVDAKTHIETIISSS